MGLNKSFDLCVTDQYGTKKGKFSTAEQSPEKNCFSPNKISLDQSNAHHVIVDPQLGNETPRLSWYRYPEAIQTCAVLQDVPFFAQSVPEIKKATFKENRDFLH